LYVAWRCESSFVSDFFHLPYLVLVACVAVPHVNFTSLFVAFAGVETNPVAVFDLSVSTVKGPSLVPVAAVTDPHMHLPAVASPLTRIEADPVFILDEPRCVVIGPHLVLVVHIAAPHVDFTA